MTERDLIQGGWPSKIKTEKVINTIVGAFAGAVVSSLAWKRHLWSIQTVNIVPNAPPKDPTIISFNDEDLLHVSFDDDDLVVISVILPTLRSSRF